MDSLYFFNQYIALLLRKFVSREDRVLVDFVFSSAPSQSDLDSCLSVCDIEAMGASKSLLLSYVMAAHPHLRFSSYTAPRLKGLINYARFSNLRTLSHFSKIGKTLNKERIPMLIFKGGAIKFLRPGLMRPMGDIDLFIPLNRLAEAVRLCRELGYRNDVSHASHAVDIHTPSGDGAVDLHHEILDKCQGKELFHERVLARSDTERAFGVEVLLPCFEDLLFIALVNMAKDLGQSIKTHTLFYTLMDCCFLLARNTAFNWDIVVENARITDTQAQLKISMALLNRLVFGCVPELHLPVSRQMRIYCERRCWDEEYFARRLKPGAWQRQISSAGMAGEVV